MLIGTVMRIDDMDQNQHISLSYNGRGNVNSQLNEMRNVDNEPTDYQLKNCLLSKRDMLPDGKQKGYIGEKPYNCLWENCGKSFSTRYALKSHLRVHTGEKPYNCTFASCSKAFKTAGDLQKHIRTHTGEKPFKCYFNGCEKAFTTSNIRKVHMRTHTGERPYKCPFPDCEKTFSTATNFKNHVRIHTGEKPFWCDYPSCGKRFTEYSSYYKHQIVHTERNTYTCSLCGRYYTYSSTLLSHKKAAHNDESGIQEVEKLKSCTKYKKKKSLTLKYTAEADTYKLPRNEGTIKGTFEVSAVLPGSSKKQLAVLTHDGENQQFTLALTDHGSTILLPSTCSGNDCSAKNESSLLYVSDIIRKDNTLQRIEASVNDLSNRESTPINEDIWLHQPPKDNNTSDIVIRDEHSAKDHVGIDLNLDSAPNACNSDSVAYLEIGGAKYQLKIVLSENVGDDQICIGTAAANCNDNVDFTDAPGDVKYSELTFWGGDCFSPDRLDPDGSQRCEPFTKKKKS